MCVILDLCKTRGRGKKPWNGVPFLIFTGAPKVLSEFAPRGYVILDTSLYTAEAQDLKELTTDPIVLDTC